MEHTENNQSTLAATKGKPLPRQKEGDQGHIQAIKKFLYLICRDIKKELDKNGVNFIINDF